MIHQIMQKTLILCSKTYQILILLLLCPGLNAQMVIPLYKNSTVKKYLRESKSLKKSTRENGTVPDTLMLPFFDDFSKILVFPDPTHWTDRDAFINATFAVEPVTYGVATLDAINAEGNIYNVGSNPTLCDNLTSHPLYLSAYGHGTDTVYLSFFFQAKGYGEIPEPKDSLVVEFYSPKDTIWIRIWSTPGIPEGPFQRQIITIPDTLLQDGFQFRFRNYVSMSEKDTQSGKGALGNFDIWNLDYVRLDNESRESHQHVYDISIIHPLKSSFINYQSIPWNHVDSGSFNNKRSFIPITIRTNDRPPGSLDTISIGRGYYLKDGKTGKYIISPFLEGSEEMWFDSVYLREDAFSPLIKYDGSEYGIIETGAFLNGTKDVHRINDTVTRTEYFRNYYAYDDGTPERGFGNPGPVGGFGSIILVHYRIYRTDSLRAIDIYFNETLDHYTDNLGFQVCVFDFDQVDTVPVNLLYASDEGQLYYPQTAEKPGQFLRIVLDSALFIRNDICVGIIQHTNEFINIGYDVNNKHKNQIFVNNYGYWESLENSSDEDGSLMIRPVMSRMPVALGMKEVNNNPVSELVLAPNPASEYINLRLKNLNQQIRQISIYDATGKVINQYRDDRMLIDISGLKPGIYIIKVDMEKGVSLTGRFIKIR